MNTAYVYKWTHIPTYKWYIGSRTAKNAHPEDGYICSSKIVKPMILSNPGEWKREILATGTPFEMIKYEAELLDLFDARNDSRSFNQYNCDGKFTTAGGSSWNKGKTHSEEHKSKMSKSLKYKIPWNKGKSTSEETKSKLRAPKSKITCPHCNKEGGNSNMKRYHFDNCKQKEFK